jgi:short-subunit dehydrogenase
MELRKDNIHCMTVCPGYVKTGFQENALTGKAPASLWQRRTFAITKEQCAEAVVKGVERRARTVVTPGMGWALIFGRALLPAVIDYFLWRIYRGLDFQAKDDPL